MEAEQIRSVDILRISSPEAFGQQTIPKSKHEDIVNSLFGSIADDLDYHSARISLKTNELIELVELLHRRISNRRGEAGDVLVFESTDRKATAHFYDDLCAATHIVLSDGRVAHPWCILFVVANTGNFKSSVVLKDTLIPLCNSQNIGLILISMDPATKSIVLCQGSLPQIDEIPILEEMTGARLSDEDIRQRIDTVYGHFSVNAENGEYHIPAIFSFDRLADNVTFMNQFKIAIADALGDSNYCLIPFYIPSDGMLKICENLIEGDSGRQISRDALKELRGKTCLILVDILSPVYSIEKTIKEARENGVTRIVIAAMVSYLHDLELGGVKTICLKKTDFKANIKKDCDFCKQGSDAIDGEHIDDYTHHIREFDSITFWRLISLRDEYYRVGHWPSDRTHNHYHFRILAFPIFKDHGYGIALRMRNTLMQKNIRPSFIHKVVCADEDESNLLSIHMARALDKNERDVVSISRDLFNSVVGKQVKPELIKKYLKSNGADLKGRNVIIVDQAAHHVRTIGGLRSICDYFGCTVLACVVFLDRTPQDFSLSEHLEYLYDTNYFSLYSWHVPPRLANECPCTK